MTLNFESGHMYHAIHHYANVNHHAEHEKNGSKLLTFAALHCNFAGTNKIHNNIQKHHNTMENNDIIKIALQASYIPSSWPYCFTHECPRHEECIHFFAGQTLDTSRTTGAAIYPTAAMLDTCPHFKKLRTIRTAWGFARLFDKVTAADAPTLRKKMKEIVGGNGTYYRYHHGTRRLSPELQTQIRRLFAAAGYNNIEFEHYQSEIDL